MSYQPRDVLVGDVGAAIARLDAATDRDELRRALRDVLTNLHSWREYEARLRGVKGFWALAGGEQIERIMTWRVVDAHFAADLIELDHHELLSGPHLIPGRNLYLGAQPHFRHLTEREIEQLPDERWRRDYPYLSGKPVGQLARDARDFLMAVNA